MKRSYSFTAALAALALAAGCTLPAFAAGEVTKDENVFIILNADGSVKSQTVSNWVHSDAGLSGFADATTLQNITNLKGEWRLEQSGGSLTFEGSGSDVYYQGTTDRTPPVTAAITYTLDGAPIAAGELTGKAGRVGIHIALTNNEKYQRTIGGSLRDVYTPFVTMIAVDLPAGAFTNITAEHGTVQTDAQNQLVAFAALPGMRATFDGLLPDQLEGLYDYFLDEVTVEADTGCFEAPAILLAAATSMEELKKDGLAGTDGLEDLDGKLDELENATRELQDGAKTLRQAVDSLDGKMAEFQASYQTFDEGVDAVLAGAKQVKDGAGQLAEGANALVTGAEQLGGASAPLKAAIDAGQAKAQTLLSDYGALQTGMAGLLQQVNGIKTTMNTMIVDSGDSGNPALIDRVTLGAAQAGAEQAIAYCEQQFAGAASNDSLAGGIASGTGLSEDQVKAVLSAAAAAVNGGLETNKAAIAGQIAQGVDGSETIAQTKAAAGAQLGSAMDGLTSQIEPTMAQAAKVMGEADELMKLVYHSADNSQTVTGALDALAQGVAALGDGPAKLQKGTAELSKGALELEQGLEKLSASSKTVKEAIGQFKAGTGALADGAVELQDGVAEYKTEGIDQITGKLGGMNLTALTELGDTLEELADGYTSYTGAPEGVRASVKFVMKVEGPKAPAGGADDGRQAARAEAQPAEKPGFWQRVKNLFR